MVKLRLFVAASLSWLAWCVAPRDIRHVFKTSISLSYGIHREMAAGKEGGIAVQSWWITEQGRKLAAEKEAAALTAARNLDIIKTGG